MTSPEPTISQLWVYLAASPLFGLTLTLVAYGIAYRVYLAARSSPLCNPVAIAVALIIGVLLLTHIPYKDYFAGAQFVHFLLGPATVALAVPLYRQLNKIRQVLLPLVITLVVGGVVGALSALYIAKALGASKPVLMSLAPKSVTTPIAMSIAKLLGGIAPLTAVLVIVTGIIGALVGTRLMQLLGIQDDSVKGVAMGLTAHGIGTARAFQVSAEMGAFAGLAMALSAFVASVLLPPLLHALGF
ncbi:MAG: LrgB family protein [Thiofilum sp.]|uniref:LrgB family protein n=1 Tax=Thiofilum sp. TaxID=2212733 RepID=UPI0025DE1E1E|nr:LrgB family protein [Thiofilum sp.]MBK8453396.1 LrgB family protein [Thiofilum sp.]